MGRVIFVTAFKGGVGKTTVAAGLASALASLGKRVCVVDADFGMRCMDLVLGMENDALYDCSDVLYGRCGCEEAICPVNGKENLWFLPAPIRYDGSELPDGKAEELFAYLRENFDFCIVDSSAELSPYYRSFAGNADEALVVTLHQSTAVRAAEKTASNLAALGLQRIRLVVNGYKQTLADAGELPTLLEMIYRSAVPLIGAVPMSEEIPVAQEHGRLALSGKPRRKLRPYEAALLNIALRVCDAHVPLLRGVRHPTKLRTCLKEASESLSCDKL